MSNRVFTNRISQRSQQIIIGLLAVGFGLLIVAIIVIANRGQLNRYFGFLDDIPYGDKIGHFVLMGIFSLLVNLSFMAKRIEIGGWKILLGSALVAAIVTVEELSQGFLINRTMDISDWLADMAGIILAGQIAIWIIEKQRSSTG